MTLRTTCKLTAEKAQIVLELRQKAKTYKQISAACLRKGLSVFPPDITWWRQKGEKFTAEVDTDYFIKGEEYDFGDLWAMTQEIMADEMLHELTHLADKAARAFVTYAEAQKDETKAAKARTPVPARYLVHQLRARFWVLQTMVGTKSEITAKVPLEVSHVVPMSELFGEKEGDGD